jgi:hypothetical protein
MKRKVTKVANDAKMNTRKKKNALSSSFLKVYSYG